MNNTLQVQLKGSSLFDLKSVFDDIGTTKNVADTFSFKDTLENKFKDSESSSSYSEAFKSNNSSSLYQKSSEYETPVREERNVSEEKYAKEENYQESKDYSSDEHNVENSYSRKQETNETKNEPKTESNTVKDQTEKNTKENTNTENNQKTTHNSEEKKSTGENNSSEEKTEKKKTVVQSMDNLANLKISNMSTNLINNILNQNVKPELVMDSSAKQAAAKTVPKNKVKTNNGKNEENVKNESVKKAEPDVKKSETATATTTTTAATATDSKKTTTENNTNNVNAKIAQKLEQDTGIKVSNLSYEVKTKQNSVEKSGDENISLLKNLTDTSKVINIRKEAAAADKMHDLKASVNDAARMEGLKSKDVQEVKTSVVSELKTVGVDAKDAALKNLSSNNSQDNKGGQQQQNMNMNMSGNNIKNQAQTSTAQAQTLASNTNMANINVIQEILNRTQNLLKSESAADQVSKNISMDFEAGSFGQMHLSLKHTGAALNISLEVSSDSSKDSLMNQRNELEKQMRDLGFKEVSVDISTSRENKERKQNNTKKGNEDIDNVKLAGNDNFDMSQVLNAAR